MIAIIVFVISTFACFSYGMVQPELDSHIVNIISKNAQQRCELMPILSIKDDAAKLDQLKRMYASVIKDYRTGWCFSSGSKSPRSASCDQSSDWLVLSKKKKLTNEEVLLQSLIVKHGLQDNVVCELLPQSQRIYVYIRSAEDIVAQVEDKLKFEHAS